METSVIRVCPKEEKEQVKDMRLSKCYGNLSLEGKLLPLTSDVLHITGCFFIEG